MKQKTQNEMMGLVFYHAHFGTHTHTYLHTAPLNAVGEQGGC